MRSYLDCIPCFMGQALRASRVAGLDDAATLEVLKRVGASISQINLSDPPPKVGKMIYSLVAQISGKSDPYAPIKREHIAMAKSLLPQMERYIAGAEDPVDAALRTAAAGNVIDLGALKTVGNVEQTLQRALNMRHKLWNIIPLKQKIAQAKSVLVLGDNAGETVFDLVMMKTLKNTFPNIRIFYSVRGGPAINDATYEDAVASGIDQVAEIISTGSAAPGILLDEVSEEFIGVFYDADIVISKGQGNYETLNDIDRQIFFVMTVKCEVVSRHLNVPVGESVLYFKQ